MDVPQELPQLFSSNAPKLHPVRSHTRNASRSPTRERIVTDDILADLSPATTLEAFTNPSGRLKASVEAATPAERAFGIRATLASKKIQEWVDELSSWSWPKEGGSVGFETPAAKRRKLSGDGFDRRGSSSGLERHGTRDTEEPEYIGSLLADDVDQYEVRVEEITEDMEDLNVEEIKRQVLDTHFSPKSRPSSSASNAPMPSLFASYTKMDDFTAIVTATVLHALPNLNKLMRLMDIWSIRLLVLRKVPPLLAALDDLDVALKSGWTAIENGMDHTHISEEKIPEFLSRQSYEIIRNVLQDKVTTLGQDLDYMLDTLEGREDTLPDDWLDRMEALEHDYGEWVVSGDRKVREGEWERMARARREEEARRKQEAEEAERLRLEAEQEAAEAMRLEQEQIAEAARVQAEADAEAARIHEEAEAVEAQRRKAEMDAEEAKRMADERREMEERQLADQEAEELQMAATKEEESATLAREAAAEAERVEGENAAKLALQRAQEEAEAVIRDKKELSDEPSRQVDQEIKQQQPDTILPAPDIDGSAPTSNANRAIDAVDLPEDTVVAVTSCSENGDVSVISDIALFDGCNSSKEPDKVHLQLVPMKVQVSTEPDVAQPTLQVVTDSVPQLPDHEALPSKPEDTTLSSPQTPQEMDTITPKILGSPPDLPTLQRHEVETSKAPKPFLDFDPSPIRRASLPTAVPKEVPIIAPTLSRSSTVRHSRPSSRHPVPSLQEAVAWSAAPFVDGQKAEDSPSTLNDEIFTGPHGEEWTFAKSHSDVRPSQSRVSSSGNLSEKALAGRTSKRHSRNISVVTGFSFADLAPGILHGASVNPSPSTLSQIHTPVLRPGVDDANEQSDQSSSPPQSLAVDTPLPAEVRTDLPASTNPQSADKETPDEQMEFESNPVENLDPKHIVPVDESQHKPAMMNIENNKEEDSFDMTTPIASRKASLPHLDTTIRQPVMPRQPSMSSDTPTIIPTREEMSLSTGESTPVTSEFEAFGDEPSPSAGRMRARSELSRSSSPSPQELVIPSKSSSVESPVSPTFSITALSDVSTSSFEAHVLESIEVSETVPVTSPKKSSDDQLQQQISSLLESIPARIHLTSEPDSKQINTLKPKKIRRSVTPSFRPSSTMSNYTRAQTPSFLLSPAYSKTATRQRPQSANPEIKLYHLSRSTGEAPIKLFVRLVGENGERVMVRVGGGWADLGEYLKEYASHHGRRSTAENDKIEIQDLPQRNVSSSTTSTMTPRGNGRSTPAQPFRPQSAFDRPMSSLNVRKTRKSMGESEGRRVPSTPIPPINRHSLGETPTSSISATGRSSSRLSWAEDDLSLGLAGPKSKKVVISEKDQEWVESMKEKVRQASAEKDREREKERRMKEKERERGGSLGEMDKVGGTKRLFRKA